MTNQQFSFCFAEALNYSEAVAFISDLALSSIWEDAPDTEISEDRLDQLREIWTAAHRTVRDIRAKIGLSQIQFAAHFGIPRRTLEDWERTGSCAPYIRLMMQEAIGLVSIRRN